MGVRAGRDHAGRFVQEVIDKTGPDAYRCTVDLDQVDVRLDPATKDRHNPVHGDTLGRDHILAGPSTTEANCG